MSYEKDKIIGLLYRIFQAEDYRWGLDNKAPTYQKIEKIVEDLEKSAYEVKGQAETGRIKVYYDKESQMYDYYLNLGSD